MNSTQKNINIVSESTVNAAPEGAAVTFINVFDEEEDDFLTASCEVYESWKLAVSEGRRALRDAAITFRELDPATVRYLEPESDEDCTSVRFQSQFGLKSSGSFDPDRKLLILRIEEDWSGQPVAEIRVLSTPEFPVRFR